MASHLDTITSTAGITASLASISKDGNSIVYELDTAGTENIYLYNVPTLTTTLLSTYLGVADNKSQFPTSSGDASVVSFFSPDAFGYTLPAGTTDEVFKVNVTSISPVLVSQTQAGQAADNTSGDSVVSLDGSKIGFASTADNLGLGSPDTAATHNTLEAYVKDINSGALTLVSQTKGGIVAGNNAAGNASSSLVTAFSADNNIVALLSDATNLAPGLGINNTYEVYTKNLTTGDLTLISEDSKSNIANGTNIYGSISSDGNLVAFVSTATNLKPDNFSGTIANAEAYVKNIATNTLTW